MADLERSRPSLPKPSKKKGLPLFPPEVIQKIVAEVREGTPQVAVAKKYGTSPRNVMRWVQKASRQGNQDTNGGTAPKQPKNVVTVVPSVLERSELDRLRAEVKQLHEAIGKQALEIIRLREQNNNRTRRGDD